MPLTITEQSVKQTDKGFRVDLVVQNSFFFGGKTQTKFRFMGAGQFDETLIPTIAKEVIDGRDDWKQGKRHQTLALNSIRSTAIITKHKNLE